MPTSVSLFNQSNACFHPDVTVDLYVCICPITCELQDLWTRHLASWFISTLSRSILTVKVMTQSSRSQKKNFSKVVGATSSKGFSFFSVCSWSSWVVQHTDSDDNGWDILISGNRSSSNYCAQTGACAERARTQQWLKVTKRRNEYISRHKWCGQQPLQHHHRLTETISVPRGIHARREN